LYNRGVTVAINPRTLSLQSPNAILAGRARRYEVDAFAGPLSLKAVVRGSAVWQTSEGRHRVSTSNVLVLNHGQRYSMLIDSPTEVETFCLFFARDFLPSAARALTAGDAALLDDPDATGSAIGFAETVQPGTAVLPLLRALHRSSRHAGANIHGFCGGPRGAHGLDITTLHGADHGFHWIDFDGGATANVGDTVSVWLRAG
jgi:hypothetical protein